MSDLDTLWMLVAAVLVFFMQAGFAMVEAGFTRAKNANNIIMKKPDGLFRRFNPVLRCRLWSYVW